MSVNSFDPAAMQQPLDAATVRRLLDLVHPFDPLASGETAGKVAGEAAGEAPALPLSTEDAAGFSSLAAHPGWGEQAESLEDAEIISLIGLFTLGEDQFSGWQAGENSPVVPLVRVLKARGVFEVTLSRWIKAHTDNKFLPHGSLLDRL